MKLAIKIFLLSISSSCIGVYSFSKINSSNTQTYPKNLINNNFPLEILGVTVTPHVHIDTSLYKAGSSTDLEDGALIQIIIKNSGVNSIKFKLLFNGLETSDSKLIQADGVPAYNKRSNIGDPKQIPEWTWCEMPQQKAYKGKEYELGAGKTDVFTYNSYRKKWGLNYSYTLIISDMLGLKKDSVHIINEPNKATLEFISLLSNTDESIFPDSAVVHIKNNTDHDFSIKKMRFYCPSDILREDPTNGLIMFKEVNMLKSFIKGGKLPAKGWSGFTCKTGKLPLVRGLVEIVLTKSGEETSLWAPLMFKKEKFEVGSGWLDSISESDSIYTAPLIHETFLKTLKLMHVSLIHNNNVNNFIPSELQSTYEFNHMLSGSSSVNEHPEIYNTEEYIRKAKQIDCLGEPNFGKTAMKAYNITKTYMLSNTYPDHEWHIPTGLDHSMPQRIRYFAGIADYPDFDNYRITAPSDDRFQKYTGRWGSGEFASKTASWGAPIESIGDITRTLHMMYKPKPIAAWSQNVHYNWGKTKKNRGRISPTPDEIYSQAYQILANGVTSLYWYSLEASSILRFKDAINISKRIGREIKMLEPLYLSGAAYSHERKILNGNPNTPDADLNVIVTPEAAMLFALDLTYVPDTAKTTASFKFKKRTIENVFFPLPSYLKSSDRVNRVDADGIYKVKFTKTIGGITIVKDSIYIGAIYIVCHDDREINEIRLKRKSLINAETSLNFDPGNNEADFQKLKKEMMAKPEQYK